MNDNYQEKVRDLYLNGVAKVQKPFDDDYLSKLINAKNKLFKEFPYGQLDDLRKIEDKEKLEREGGHMVWDIAKREPIFNKIMENEVIKKVATEVLGSNYQISSFYIRKTPKTENIMHPHIDYQGGLSFSILLDNIKNHEGETFFYKKSYKYPPPPFSKFESQTLKKDIISTTGEIGDIFFWFPDGWHGRNDNRNSSDTTILICHMGNKNFPNTNPGYKKIIKEEKTKSKNTILNSIFLKWGNSPGNILTHLLYCIFYFKFSALSNQAIKKEVPFTRKKFGDKSLDRFSLIKYFQIIKYTKLIKIFASRMIQLLFGKKIFNQIKKRIKKHFVTY